MKSAHISKSAACGAPLRERSGGDLRIGGFEPFSTVDYPGRLAAVVFCQGCPLRCGYCHNQDLIPARAEELLPYEEVFSAIKLREGFLDAVVFSGGEPLSQAAIIPAMAAVRACRLDIGLHTAGTNPFLLEAALSYVDWVGFDVKAPFDSYHAVTGVDAGARVRVSLEMLARSGIPFEVRTTVWPERIGKEDISNIASTLRDLGVRRYALQEARTQDRRLWPGGDVLDDVEFVAETAAMFERFEVRRASNV